MIACPNHEYDDEDEGCSVGPMVTGETLEQAAARWNRRAEPAAGYRIVGPADMEAVEARRWEAKWYGSPPNKGCTIWAMTEHGTRSQAVAYIGPDEQHLEIGRAICAAHNAVLTAASPLMPVPAGWQPIETAPKDGRLMLLTCVGWPPSEIRGEPWPVKVGGYWDGKWNVFGASWAPTDWAVLPSAPKPAALTQEPKPAEGEK
jgi:hypothetical protein